MLNSPWLALASNQKFKQELPRQEYYSGLRDDRAKSRNFDDILLGLWRREFHAYLQPKFDLRTGQVDAVEVLARWIHPLRGVLGPEHFIPLMERKWWLDNLIFEMIEQSFALQLKLYNQGFLLNLAINISIEQLQNSILTDGIIARLNQHPLPLSTITFEITEDGPARLSAVSIEQLKRLRDLGARLSIDDFGIGHSSLLRLCQVPFNEIKLPKELCRLFEKNAHCSTLIRNTVGLAKNLGMQLVIEGIETHMQLTRLRDMGIITGQGFVCAKPMPIDIFEDWILEHQK